MSLSMATMVIFAGIVLAVVLFYQRWGRERGTEA
jgi:hypothetical protein